MGKYIIKNVAMQLDKIKEAENGNEHYYVSFEYAGKCAKGIFTDSFGEALGKGIIDKKMHEINIFNRVLSWLNPKYFEKDYETWHEMIGTERDEFWEEHLDNAFYKRRYREVQHLIRELIGLLGSEDKLKELIEEQNKVNVAIRSCYPPAVKQMKDLLDYIFNEREDIED